VDDEYNVAMPRQLLIAARGWDHDGWAGSLYPEDLPSEWRLSYYANEFRAVLIPFGSWVAVSAESALHWRNEIHANFRFFLELPAGTAPVKELSRFRRLGGIVAVSLASPTTIEPDKPSMSLTTGAPNSGREFRAGIQEERVSVDALAFWTPRQAIKDRVTAARLEPAPTLRALRHQITSFLSHAADCTLAVMILDGEPPDLTTLRQAQQIGELLGY
jgi:hypothetical protein